MHPRFLGRSHGLGCLVFSLLVGCAATTQRAPRAQLHAAEAARRTPDAQADHPDTAQAARTQFSQAISCPEGRVTSTRADPLVEPIPPEIEADPERAALYRANHVADRREVFDVSGCDTHLRVACHGVAADVFCLPVIPPITTPAMLDTLAGQPMFEQVERAARRQARLGILRTSVTGKVVVGVVLRGSPADGKLRPADVILRAAGEPVPDGEALARVVHAHAGKPLDLTVQRDGAEVHVSVDFPSP